MQNILYHYCSINTFRSIIMNRTLRFSDITKSNDYNEIVYLWDKYYQYIDSIATNKFAVASLKREIDHQLSNTAFLALCFSNEADSLHMWNCYADGGIAIGFDISKIREWGNSICLHNFIDQNIDNGATIAKLDDVSYFDNDQIDLIVKEICKGAKFTVDSFGKIFNEAPFLKSDFFKSESEVRMLITIFMLQEYANILDYCENGKCISNIKLQTTANKNFANVLFCDVPFSPSIIKSIIIGPNCSLTKTDITQMLFANGIDVNSIEIKKSKGSYR